MRSPCSPPAVLRTNALPRVRPLASRYNRLLALVVVFDLDRTFQFVNDRDTGPYCRRRGSRRAAERVPVR